MDINNINTKFQAGLGSTTGFRPNKEIEEERQRQVMLKAYCAGNGLKSKARVKASRAQRTSPGFNWEV